MTGEVGSLCEGPLVAHVHPLNSMNILFVHNNFPAQFRHTARALASDPSVRVAAIGAVGSQSMKGVQLVKYKFVESEGSEVHPFARRFDRECRRAEQVLYSLSALAASGFVPDVIVAHPGWGETLPVKTFFPLARLIVYCEFFYGTDGRDVGFDPEFPTTGIDGHVGLHLKNASTLLALSDSDRGLSPTNWQRSTFPAHFQENIEVIHEGVDVDLAKPASPGSEAVFQLPSGRELKRTDEVVTFVARNLEPMRGYHIFMRALPIIMAKQPRAQILVIGGDDTSYGARPPVGQTWKSIFLEEVARRIDPQRVHFVGRLPYRSFLNALQVSSAHVYLTYPFVLSWSVLEAMSVGCLVIGSDTAPVREVINDRNGILVPFFDVQQLADQVIEVLRHPSRFDSMRAEARRFLVDNFDSTRLCTPRIVRLFKGLS